MWSADTHQALVEEIELFARTPALRIFGVVSGVSIGAAFMTRGYLLLAVLAALMSALAVVRHTRQNEETGRAELVGAAVVGRHAGLAAALIVTVGANIVLAGLLGLAGIVTGLPAAGSFMAGLAVGAFGIVFAGVAAVTVQLSSTTRGASGLAAAVLGLAFLVSGLGNMLGTVDASGRAGRQRMAGVVVPDGLGPADAPVRRRHLVAARPVRRRVRRAGGRGEHARNPARRRERHPRRSTRTRRGRAPAPQSVRARLAPAARRPARMGGRPGRVRAGLRCHHRRDQGHGGATADWYARMTGSDEMVEAWGTSMIEMVGMVVAIYAVQILLRMRAEEADGPLEPVLATAVSRPRWMISHVLNAGLGALLLLLVFAVSMGLAAGLVLGDVPGQLRALVEAGLVQLPGIMVIGGVVVAVTALLPRWAGTVSWTVVMVFILLGPLFGAATFQLPPWVQDISPFTHIPKAPAAAITAAPRRQPARDLGSPRRGRSGGIPPPQPCPPNVREGDPRRRT